MEQFKIIKNSVDSVNRELKDFDKKTDIEQIQSSCMAIVDLVVICIQVDSIVKDLQCFADWLNRGIPPHKPKKPMLLLPQHTE